MRPPRTEGPILDWWGRKNPMTREQRFRQKVYERQDNSCWEWIGGFNKYGYGRFVHEGGTTAHRYSWILHNGPIPDGLWVLHKCDRPYCVNPEHLFLGNALDNKADSVFKDRHARGERSHNAVLTAADVMAIRSEYVYRKNSFAKLARKFGIATPTVKDIICGRSWKHLLTEQSRPELRSE